MSVRPPADPTSECPFYSADTYDWRASTGHLLALLHHSMRRALDTELATLGDVSSAQWVVLMILSHQQDVTAADLAKFLNHDPGSMTRLLDRLQEKGLIQRDRDGEDRRCIRLALTEAGRALSPQLPGASISVLNRALAGFTTAEHEQLDSLLRRMLHNLKAEP